MTDHEAVQEMLDNNKQRLEMHSTEVAALLALEVEDIKHQGGQLDDVAEGDKGNRSVENEPYSHAGRIVPLHARKFPGTASLPNMFQRDSLSSRTLSVELPPPVCCVYFPS